MSEDFLSRWSRLKRGASEAPVEAPDEALELHSEPGLLAPESDEMIKPDEIAALPAPEALLPGADLAPFLRRGVPAALRNAALRRMWAVDPEIRDFVGEARDYAWDWNVPGGVPVSGPLPEGFDVEGMVRRIFGGGLDADGPDPAVEPLPPVDQQEPAPVAALRDDPPPASVAADGPECKPASDSPSSPFNEPADAPLQPRQRRHGSALPS
ncbi:DUF3306 domain-containing protein [Antarcticirhabdus aurantiaca]|uniref:DUF3306 domain-containing protein n=1 Tax=Antarcticirhabdus aurantiaca TaxID=2606717 RepID=A0ACD4NUZ4_9HYPH|nr:DUF3306 domain-containing protein [Antarcticirhabdus aurantiaca]WAJ30781.1 DUF3306 domain-containing protein [Jeongeuplla avenae]